MATMAIRYARGDADEMGNNGTDTVHGGPSDDGDDSHIVIGKNGDWGKFIIGWQA